MIATPLSETLCNPAPWSVLGTSGNNDSYIKSSKEDFQIFASIDILPLKGAEMTVRDLVKKLLEFNQDLEVKNSTFENPIKTVRLTYSDGSGVEEKSPWVVVE